MAIPPFKVDFKSSEQTSNEAGSGGGFSTPFDSLMPWNSIKNYSNHSSGANQSASATATKAGGQDSGGFGGLSLTTILLIGAAYLLLK